MRLYLPYLFLAMFLLPLSLSAQRGMTNKKITKIFRQQEIMTEGEDGAWLVHIREHILLFITDEENNRMRIFTPIIEEKQIGPELLEKMLRANFRSALDAKYSLYDGFVVSVFTHPLRELTEAQMLDAMEQVAKLSDTFGTTFSSTDLHYGGEEEPPAEAEPVEERS